MKKKLSETTFEEMKNKTFELVQIVEMLCEVCQQPLSKKERVLRTIQVSTKGDYENVMARASIHDRADIDINQNRIYFYDHDFPGDVHPECLEKL